MPDKLQAWIDARRRHGLSHVHVQMARELGMNPNKLGKLDNADQEPWKQPLPAFIENLYQKRLNQDRPDASCPSRNALASKNRRRQPGAKHNDSAATRDNCGSAQIEELSKALSCRWLSAGYVAGNLVLVEDSPDSREESW